MYLELPCLASFLASSQSSTLTLTAAAKNDKHRHRYVPGVALPGQLLGLIAKQHTDIDGQHVSHAGGQQLVQAHEDDHVISQFEQVATVPLADATHLHSDKQGIWNRCYAPACIQAGHLESMLCTCIHTSRAVGTDAMHLRSYKQGIWNLGAYTHAPSTYMQLLSAHSYKQGISNALSALSAEDAVAAQLEHAVKQAWLLCSLNGSVA